MMEGCRPCSLSKVSNRVWEMESKALERSISSMSWVLEREGLDSVCATVQWMVWSVLEGRNPC